MSSVFYKPSSRYDLVSTLIFFLGGVVVAATLALIYSLICWFIPFIYLNVIFAGFSIVLF